jgi:hypothetical protein
MILADLYKYINQFSYAGIFLWFALLEQLTPAATVT